MQFEDHMHPTVLKCQSCPFMIINFLPFFLSILHQTRFHSLFLFFLVSVSIHANPLHCYYISSSLYTLLHFLRLILQMQTKHISQI